MANIVRAQTNTDRHRSTEFTCIDPRRANSSGRAGWSPALDAAVAARGGRVADVIFHSDRGSQYSSSAFADVCRRHGVHRSMGRIGSSYDNALAEAFFATLKRELDVDQRRWATEADAS